MPKMVRVCWISEVEGALHSISWRETNTLAAIIKGGTSFPSSSNQHENYPPHSPSTMTPPYFPSHHSYMNWSLVSTLLRSRPWQGDSESLVGSSLKIDEFETHNCSHRFAMMDWMHWKCECSEASVWRDCIGRLVQLPRAASIEVVENYWLFMKKRILLP